MMLFQFPALLNETFSQPSSDTISCLKTFNETTLKTVFSTILVLQGLVIDAKEMSSSKGSTLHGSVS